MKWQVNYALENIKKINSSISAEHIQEEAIKVTAHNQPEIVAIISDAYIINTKSARQYSEEYPEMDFLCGYRKECVWEGEAITYLENNSIGWGSAGTLNSAILDGNVNTAAHKEYFFSYRLINQMKSITNVREFDRVFTVAHTNGKTLRIGMIMEYEPTADAVRSFWERFGPIDVAWNINPNGFPTQNAIEAGRELGCKVMKWEELRRLLRNP